MIWPSLRTTGLGNRCNSENLCDLTTKVYFSSYASKEDVEKREVF